MTRGVQASGTGIILITLLLAAILDVMPWFHVLDWLRPQWLVLVMIFWVLTLPDRVGVFWGLGVGIFQDVLLNTLLGQHALALTVTCFLTLLAYRRLSRLGVLLQSVMVFFLVGIDLWINYILQDATSRADTTPYLILGLAFASGVVWLPVQAFLRMLRQQFLVR